MSNKSNSMIVKNMIRKHIADNLDATSVEELRQALTDMQDQIAINRTYRMTYYDAVAYTIGGLYKGFLYRNSDVREFINSLDINNHNSKEYDDEQCFVLYKHLIARELPYMERLSDKKLAELL